MKLKQRLTLRSLYSTAMVAIIATGIAYTSKAQASDNSNLLHPLGQTQVIATEPAALVYDNKYGAIRLNSETSFKKKHGTLNHHPVFASASGYIYVYGINNDGTYRLVINHVDGNKTYYSNIQADSIQFNDNKPVIRGEIIGYIEGDQFDFSAVDHTGRALSSDFKEQQAGEYLHAIVLPLKTSTHAFIAPSDKTVKTHQKKLSIVNQERLHLTGNTQPPSPPGDDGGGDDGESPVQSIPSIDELYPWELPPLPENHYNPPGEAPSGVIYRPPTGAYSNSPEQLETGYCTPEARRILNSKQSERIGVESTTRSRNFSDIQSIASMSCSNMFQAVMLGQISQTFSGRDGAFGDMVTDLLGDFGITVGEDGVDIDLGDIADAVGQLSQQGCAGSRGLIQAMRESTTGTSMLASGYVFTPGRHWRQQSDYAVGQPPGHYVSAKEIGRYEEPNADGFFERKTQEW